MGLFENAEYAQGATTLAKGDVLVLYTDGITEAINTQEQEFGEERLEQLVIQQADRPAQELAERIVNATADFAGSQAVSAGSGIFDDETLVVIKRESGG